MRSYSSVINDCRLDFFGKTYNGMAWLKEANKLGKYSRTYRGFRLYYTHIRIIAIDKTGCRLESQTLEEIGFKIDIELMQRYYDKRGW